MHLAQTCRTWSLAQIHQLNVMKQYVKVPTLFIESDIVDVRMYSEADTQRRIDAFIETVASYKTR
jgi:benzoyl-CoA reductase/2-hydroxyglutaryl-CoA dehydratase subunit BcrC/BadD/HgdB